MAVTASRTPRFARRPGAGQRDRPASLLAEADRGRAMRRRCMDARDASRPWRGLSCAVPMDSLVNGSWTRARNRIHATKRLPEEMRRNVLDHRTDERKPSVARQMNAACALEETLTVHRLDVPLRLRRAMASTNVIESAFSIAERVCANMKHWHGGSGSVSIRGQSGVVNRRKAS